MSNENQNLNKTADAIPHADEPESRPAPHVELTVVPPVTDENADVNTATVDIEPGHELAEMQAVSMLPAIDLNEAKRGLEAALLAASEPMPLQELKKIFEGELNADILRNLLDELRAEWADRSVELAIVASGYRFRVKPDYQKYIDRLANEKPPKYSRAVLETMAIIAYRQPVTRSDIEDIRGVAVSPHILKTLEDRGWIDEIGHKDAPGRPALFATTKHFLDDLNLLSLDELPPLHELQATLDMSQAGAALHASAETLALPGVAHGEVGADVEGNDAASESSDETNANPTANQNVDVNENTNKTDVNNQNAIPESAGEPHENHPQEPGAAS
jgi:segregation and condensation protein B